MAEQRLLKLPEEWRGSISPQDEVVIIRNRYYRLEVYDQHNNPLEEWLINRKYLSTSIDEMLLVSNNDRSKWAIYNLREKIFSTPFIFDRVELLGSYIAFYRDSCQEIRTYNFRKNCFLPEGCEIISQASFVDVARKTDKFALYERSTDTWLTPFDYDMIDFKGEYSLAKKGKQYLLLSTYNNRVIQSFDNYEEVTLPFYDSPVALCYTKKKLFFASRVKCGLVNLRTTKVLLPFEFEEIRLIDSKCKYAKCTKSNTNGRWGVINVKTNKEVLPFIYNDNTIRKNRDGYFGADNRWFDQDGNEYTPEGLNKRLEQLIREADIDSELEDLYTGGHGRIAYPDFSVVDW